MNAREELLRRLDNYYSGTSSDEEKRFIDLYFKELQQKQDFTRRLTKAEKKELETSIFAEMASKMAWESQPKVGPVSTEGKGQFWKLLQMTHQSRYKGLAYVFAACTLLASVGWWLTGNWPSLYYQESVTRKGALEKVILSDHSVVWLNAESRLRFPRHFSASSRDIYLQGEAYFQVAKDQTRPFKVHTGALITQAVGTEFNVKAYRATIEVTLLKGKVMLTAPGRESDTLYLQPSERAYYFSTHLRRVSVDNQRELVNLRHRSINAVAASKLPSANLSGTLENSFLKKEKLTSIDATTSWRKGILIFQGESLAEALESVQRRYNVTVRADSALLDQPVFVQINEPDIRSALFALCAGLKRKVGPQGMVYLAQFKRVTDGYRIQ